MMCLVSALYSLWFRLIDFGQIRLINDYAAKKILTIKEENEVIHSYLF